MADRQSRVGARAARCRQRCVANSRSPREARQVPAHVLAEHGIDFARSRQRVAHGRRRERPLQERLVGKNQNALDLALDLGRDVDGKIGADSARFGSRREHRQYEQRHSHGGHNAGYHWIAWPA